MVLISSYVNQHASKGPVKIGILTGKSNMQTYHMRIEFTPDKKREYSTMKNQVQDYFNTNDIKFNFEFDEQGMSLLFDMQDQHIHKVHELVGETTLDVKVKEVHEIGDEEKKILMKRVRRSYR
jgi:hypothetical protein